MIAPYVLTDHSDAFPSDIVIGGLVLVISAIETWRLTRETAQSM
jgi:hypothetical protein